MQILMRNGLTIHDRIINNWIRPALVGHGRGEEVEMA